MLLRRWITVVQGFLYLKNKFPTISEDKIKEGIFVIPQIWDRRKDHGFEEGFNEVEKGIRKSFKKVVIEYVGNRNAENYGELVSGTPSKL